MTMVFESFPDNNAAAAFGDNDIRSLRELPQKYKPLTPR